MARTSESSSAPATEQPLPEGCRVAAVVSTFHADLTRAMAGAARETLIARGLAEADYMSLEVAGSFELPLVARRLAVREDIDLVLCFGLVLKGETPHDVYISQATAQGILQVSLETDTPILFGVLTCNTLEQARARALPASEGGSHDKGAEVARAGIAAVLAMRAAPELGMKPEQIGFGGGA